MTNWTDIHVGFYKYQQRWEQANITKQEAKEWIELGFALDDLDEVKQWKNFNFSPTETKTWLEVGLDKKKDWEFASWLRTNNHIPELVKNNLEKLGTDYNLYWLTKHYPNHNIKELYIMGENLKGELNLSQYQQLERLNCSWNSLTNITLPNNSTSLKYLDLRSNNFNQDLSFLIPYTNLEELDLRNNKFTGSLEPLKGLIKLTNLDIRDTLLAGSLDYLSGMEKLKYLNISNTDINEVQIDKLPRSLERIEYSIYWRPDCKLTEIVSQLQEYEWKGLHADFSLEKRRIWEGGGFNKEQTGEWINSGWKVNDYHTANQWKKFDFTSEQALKWKNNNFSPYEAKQLSNSFSVEECELVEQWKKIGFASFQLISKGLKKEEVEFASYLKKKGYHSEVPYIENKITQEAWRDIHPDFTYLIRKEWEKKGFSKEQVKEWINAGLQPSYYEFITWLRDIKKVSPEWISNNEQESQELKRRYNRYGLCKECQQPRVGNRYGNKWCSVCNSDDNPVVADLLQKYQLIATQPEDLLKWIPYGQFWDIEYLAEGNFGTVSKARWNNKTVALKSLKNSAQGVTNDFLQEIAHHKLFKFDWVVKCHGVSKNPKTGDYVMVMEYIRDGDLKHYSPKDCNKLSFKDKLTQLSTLASGLKAIHEQGLIHRDFHSGNILRNGIYSHITDLGLSRPINEDNDGKVYGVIPYIAPEVLRNKPYTQSSDIYSFGIIAHKILTGLTPYSEQIHETNLALAICQGERPQFNIKIPSLLEDLIKQCWDNDPLKRPTAWRLEIFLKGWRDDMYRSYSEFSQQYQKAEEYNQTLSDEVKYPNYQPSKGAVWSSEQINIKQITQLLESSEQITMNSSTQEQSILLKSEEIAPIEIEGQQHQAQTEQPPK